MKKGIMFVSVVFVAVLIAACHSGSIDIDEPIDEDIDEYIVNPILTLKDEDAVRAKLNQIASDYKYIYIPFRGSAFVDLVLDEQRPQDGGVFRMCKVSGEVVRLSYDSAYGLTECNGYLYYFNEHDANHLYRMKTDGTERSRFAELEYGTGRSYSYNGCQLYFSPGETDWGVAATSVGKTYVMDLVTGEYEEILPMHALDFHVSEPWIYFTPASDYQQIMDGLIWRVKKDGTSLEEVAQGIEFPRVMIDGENYLYMKFIPVWGSSQGGYSKAIKFNVVSKEEEELYTFPKGGSIQSFYFKDGWLYWRTLSGIYRSDKDTTEEIQLPSKYNANVIINILGIEGEWIFYEMSMSSTHEDFESYVKKFDQNKQLHAVKIDGSKNVVINPDFDY